MSRLPFVAWKRGSSSETVIDMPMNKSTLRSVSVEMSKGVFLETFADVISFVILSEINITLLKATVSCLNTRPYRHLNNSRCT